MPTAEGGGFKIFSPGCKRNPQISADGREGGSEAGLIQVLLKFWEFFAAWMYSWVQYSYNQPI
jgi:hypothetical protein